MAHAGPSPLTPTIEVPLPCNYQFLCTLVEKFLAPLSEQLSGQIIFTGVTPLDFWTKLLATIRDSKNSAMTSRQFSRSGNTLQWRLAYQFDTVENRIYAEVAQATLVDLHQGRVTI